MVELESEGELTRNEVASFLREFANELDDHEIDGDRQPVREEDPERATDKELLEPKQITFVIGGESATVTLPNVVEFEVEVESRAPMLRSNVNQEIEFELSWQIDKSEEEFANDQMEMK